MPRKNPPTARMRRLGVQLRTLREDRGLTLDEAGDLLKISKSALHRMENAQIITNQTASRSLGCRAVRRA